MLSHAAADPRVKPEGRLSPPGRGVSASAASVSPRAFAIRRTPAAVPSLNGEAAFLVPVVCSRPDDSQSRSRCEEQMSSALSRFQQNSMQIVRAAVVALAVLSMLITIMPAIMSNVDPDGNPNPFSTEYGGYLRMWAATIVLAIAMLAPALACAGRRGRQLLLATAIVVAAVSAGPARHYYRYFHCENGVTASPCLPPLLHETFPFRIPFRIPFRM
jgi:hypothetical protein